MRRLRPLGWALAPGLLSCAATASRPPAPPSAPPPEPTLSSRVAALECRSGLFTVCLDPGKGAVLAVLPAPEAGGRVLGRYLYGGGLTAGLGSNPVGLDRGMRAGGAVLRLEQAGDKVHFVVENHAYAALDAGPAAQRASRESFAESVVFAASIEARAEDRLLVDLTEFSVSDPVDLIGRLRRTGQGSFSIDPDRSAPRLDQVLVFPKNVEIDARVTLVSSEPGDEVASVTPDPRAVSLIQHHSFVALPEPGYAARRSDVRSGALEMTVTNTAAPLDGPVRTGFALRHRLERVVGADGAVTVPDPIVYYVDPGAPPSVRRALVEGASWWAEAFELAGFPGGFRVEILPEDVHPLDIRYNTIQWVHRRTRGWSYGGAIVDPRTGEIVNGDVTLGSLRIRQDRMIFEGLLGAERTGEGGPDDPLELALARIRQLSAHEVGHTLGLMHNFAASTVGRASVMDYPAPLVTVGEDGRLDTSRAYDVGVGAWDVAAIRWLYSEVPDGLDERAFLDGILEEARASGLKYLSDRHARGSAAADPDASLWDNGEDPVGFLEEVLAVREVALARFGVDSLAAGRPASELRSVFTPIYLYHRFQTEAAAKAIGGVRFRYQVADGDLEPMTPVSPVEQRRALQLILRTVEPEFLAIDDAVRARLQPDVVADYDRSATTEIIDSHGYPAFSELDAARVAARISLGSVLAPARLARLAEQAARDDAQMPVGALLARVERVVFARPAGDLPKLRALREAVQTTCVDLVLRLAGAPIPRVAAPARRWLEERAARPGRGTHERWLAGRITSGLTRIDRGEALEPLAPRVPPGSPIGHLGRAVGPPGGA